MRRMAFFALVVFANQQSHLGFTSCPCVNSIWVPFENMGPTWAPWGMLVGLLLHIFKTNMILHSCLYHYPSFQFIQPPQPSIHVFVGTNSSNCLLPFFLYTIQLVMLEIQT